MTAPGLILRALLLLALLVSGSVPQGFMRAGGAGGMLLVLCSAEGPQEIRLLPDGGTAPVDTEKPKPGKCLSVALTLPAQPRLALTPIQIDTTRQSPWRQTHQIATCAPPPHRTEARAPPRPALRHA